MSFVHIATYSYAAMHPITVTEWTGVGHCVILRYSIQHSVNFVLSFGTVYRSSPRTPLCPSVSHEEVQFLDTCFVTPVSIIFNNPLSDFSDNLSKLTYSTSHGHPNRPPQRAPAPHLSQSVTIIHHFIRAHLQAAIPSTQRYHARAEAGPSQT